MCDSLMICFYSLIDATPKSANVRMRKHFFVRLKGAKCYISCRTPTLDPRMVLSTVASSLFSVCRLVVGSF